MNKPVSGFTDLLSDLKIFLKEKTANGSVSVSGVDLNQFIEKLFNQGGFFSFFDPKMPLAQRVEFIKLLSLEKETINRKLETYINGLPRTDFDSLFWFNEAGQFDPSLFRELISLDLENTNFRNYETSRGVTIQHLVNTLISQTRKQKTNAQSPVQQFLWKYISKGIKYCDSIYDLMGSLPTHPATIEIKEALGNQDGVDFGVIIDELLGSEIDKNKRSANITLLMKHREKVEQVIKKYIRATAASGGKTTQKGYGLASLTDFMSRFRSSRDVFVPSEDAMSKPNTKLEETVCLANFWTIIYHGLTQEDFRNINSKDNERVRDIIARMLGAIEVHPFVNGYARITKDISQRHYPVANIATGYIDTNFDIVVYPKYLVGEDAKSDGTAKVGVKGKYVDRPGPGGHDASYYETNYTTINLKTSK